LVNWQDIVRRRQCKSLGVQTSFQAYALFRPPVRSKPSVGSSNGIGDGGSRYHFDRQQVTAALGALLDVMELEFQTEPALEQALWLSKQAGSRDYLDCLHVALASHAGQGPLLTFDERASRIEGAQLLQD